MTEPDLRAIVKRAFFDVHDGRSTDDVVIDDALNGRFLDKCKESVSEVSDFELNWRLLSLRKGSSLGSVVTKVSRNNHNAYLHAAEIAARHVEDTSGATIDRALCDPSLRRSFDTTAREVAPAVSTYLLRKAALRLRKGRQLKPELTKRVTEWSTQVRKFAASELQADTSQIPRVPGIYLFYDHSGYLYIGEAANLRVRVAKHLDHSDRKALARYLWEQGTSELWVELHCFDPLSGGRLASARRAYEASLIQSRCPRFNIQLQA